MDRSTRNERNGPTRDARTRSRSHVRARGAAAGAARAVLLALLLAALAVTSLVAQEAPERLSLDEAIRLAREYNPNFQSVRNDQSAADWGVREAYGQFLPSASAGGTMTYTEAGVQRIGTLDFGAQSTDWYSSGYGLNLNWSVDGNTFFGVSNARAQQRATSARIDATRFTLESGVTLQYMAALRARDAVDVARRQLDRAVQNQELIEARVEAGAAAGTEAKQAAVDRGRAEVALIQAEQLLRAQKLLLGEQLGVSLSTDVELVSSFAVFEPAWSSAELLSFALERHPSLRAFEAQERASVAGVRQARSSYFPSVNLSTRFSGNTLQALNDEFLVTQATNSVQGAFNSCRRWQIIQSSVDEPLPGIQDMLAGGCGNGVLTDAQRDAVLASNDVFPFDFTKNPLSLSLSVQIPVFNGFSRERQLEQAEAAADDARHQRRAEELRLRTAVTQAHNDLVAAHQVVEIEARNRELAEERLELARQRYAIGAGPARGGGAAAGGGGSTFLELLDALASMTTAERDYLNAVYDFHLALAQLEAATGRTLRPEGTGGDGAASQVEEGR